MNDRQDARNATQGAAERADSHARSNGTGSPDASASKLIPARFAFVCSSRDGRLCLFQDADGHYTAVRTARLA